MIDELLSGSTADLRRPPPEVLNARLDGLLSLDAPTPSASFDTRFAERLTAQRLIERVHAEEAAAPVLEVPGLDALLSRDQPTPSADFDTRFRFFLRRVMVEDGGLRTVAPEALRVPALPPRGHHFTTLPKPGTSPFTMRRVYGIGGLAAAGLFGLWLVGAPFDAVKNADAVPPPESLPLVAHLDLLESLDAVEHIETLSPSVGVVVDRRRETVARLDPAVVEAAEDDELFQLVADLDALEATP